MNEKMPFGLRPEATLLERANAYVAHWNTPLDPDLSFYGTLIRELRDEVVSLQAQCNALAKFNAEAKP